MTAVRSTATGEHALEELLLRCGSQDEAAFAEYYRLTSPVLGALATRRSPSPATVDDSLVQIYVDIWHQAADFSYSGAQSAWEWTMGILDRALPPPECPAQLSRPPRWRRTAA